MTQSSSTVLLYSSSSTLIPLFEHVYTLLENREDFTPLLVEDIKSNKVLAAEVTAVVCSAHCSQGIDEYIKTLPHLKLVIFSSAGIENLPLDYCHARGIRVGNGSAFLGPIIAEFAMALLLCMARKIRQYEKLTLDYAESNKSKGYLRSTHLVGKTLGIVGMGSIGLEIAKRAKSFGLKIIYHNRQKKSSEIEQEVCASYYSTLHDLLMLSDFVVISCPHSQDTHNMFDQKEFTLMKKSAVLINIARGKIVNTEALVAALQQAEIGGAALDVTEPEPLPAGHALLDMDNVICTGHRAFDIEHHPARSSEYILRGLIDGLAGGKLPSEVSTFRNS